MYTFRFPAPYVSIRPVNGSQYVGLMNLGKTKGMALELGSAEKGEEFWRWSKKWFLHQPGWMLPTSTDLNTTPFVAEGYVPGREQQFVQWDPVLEKWDKRMALPGLPAVSFSRFYGRWAFTVHKTPFEQECPLGQEGGRWFDHMVLKRGSPPVDRWEFGEYVERMYGLRDRLVVVTRVAANGSDDRYTVTRRLFNVGYVLSRDGLTTRVSSGDLYRSEEHLTGRQQTIRYEAFWRYLLSGDYEDDPEQKLFERAAKKATENDPGITASLFGETTAESADCVYAQHPSERRSALLFGRETVRVGGNDFQLSHVASKLEFSADGCTLWCWGHTIKGSPVTVIDV